jgi:acyl carrier protein
MTNSSEQGTVAEQIQHIICQQTGYEEALTPETDLLNDLAIDSLELVELGLVIAKALGTKLPRGEVRQCITVGELTELVERVFAEAQEQSA